MSTFTFFINELLDKVLADIQVSKDEITFTLDDGKQFKMYHIQDCCESVEVEDVIGNTNDLIGSPLLMAEEVIHENKNPEGNQDSYTWTFYKFATTKGYVTIRWYGESNGNYSERVDFVAL